MVLKWLDRDAAGEPVGSPETGFKWNELGRLAQKFYPDYEDVPYPQLIERLAAAKCRIVALIEARCNDDLYGRPWYENGRWAAWFSSTLHRHTRMHAGACGSG